MVGLLALLMADNWVDSTVGSMAARTAASKVGSWDEQKVDGWVAWRVGLLAGLLVY